MNWGKGISFRKPVVLEIVLLRRKGDMMGETFSGSFVRDCSSLDLAISFGNHLKKLGTAKIVTVNLLYGS